jgi:hypothetical protein
MKHPAPEETQDRFVLDEVGRDLLPKPQRNRRRQRIWIKSWICSWETAQKKRIRLLLRRLHLLLRSKRRMLKWRSSGSLKMRPSTNRLVFFIGCLSLVLVLRYLLLSSYCIYTSPIQIYRGGRPLSFASITQCNDGLSTEYNNSVPWVYIVQVSLCLALMRGI